MYKPRIYVHAPYRPDRERAPVKDAILRMIAEQGFDLQEFHVSGLPRGDSWTFKRAVEVMNQCDGALILALARWVDTDGESQLPIPSEYAHFEGALAVSRGLPTLVIGEESMQRRGILSQLGGTFVVQIPMHDSRGWIDAHQLLAEPSVDEWLERVISRYDVFFGYCSKADKLAQDIKSYLEDDGFRVLDWATGFRIGRSIMTEVSRAAAISRCGLFLFTADDPVEGLPSATAIPRDNVLLEAGFFMNATSPGRVLVVREVGTKMPADLGGIIYLSIGDRSDWRKTAREIADSVRSQMLDDSV